MTERKTEFLSMPEGGTGGTGATAEQLAQIAQNAEAVSELKSDIADINNKTESPVAAGKVWTSTENGAGWAAPNCGSIGVTEGGHWETLFADTWANKATIQPTAYDTETGLFTATNEELDLAFGYETSIEALIYPNSGATNSDMPGEDERLYIRLTRIGDTDFSFSNNPSVSATMNPSKFRFEVPNYAIFSNINANKIRLTAVGQGIFGRCDQYKNVSLRDSRARVYCVLNEDRGYAKTYCKSAVLCYVAERIGDRFIAKYECSGKYTTNYGNNKVVGTVISDYSKTLIPDSSLNSFTEISDLGGYNSYLGFASGTFVCLERWVD